MSNYKEINGETFCEDSLMADSNKYRYIIETSSIQYINGIIDIDNIKVKRLLIEEAEKYEISYNNIFGSSVSKYMKNPKFEYGEEVSI